MAGLIRCDYVFLVVTFLVKVEELVRFSLSIVQYTSTRVPFL